MMIDHAFQRQELGTELLQQVEKSLGCTCEELRLESFEANDTANALTARTAGKK